MYTVSFTVVLRLSFGGTANSRIDPVNGPYLCRIESEQELVFLRVDPSRTRMIFISQLFEFTKENVHKKAGKLLRSTDTIAVQHTTEFNRNSLENKENAERKRWPRILRDDFHSRTSTRDRSTLTFEEISLRQRRVPTCL